MKYQPRLDTLRFFSVLLVIISHWLPNSEIVMGIPFLGDIGVSFFFVISGYLITSILIRLKEKKLSKGLGIFYWNRSLRIFPIYYLLLIALFFMNLEFWENNALYLFTYLTNFRIFVLDNWIGAFSHLWSLAVEEQFYLIWPLVIFMVRRDKIVLSVCVTFIISYILKILVYFSLKSNYIEILPFSQFDLFMFGALLSLKTERVDHVIKSFTKTQVLLTFFSLSLLVYITGPVYLLKNLALGLTSVFLILFMNLNYSIHKFFDFKPFIFLGKISYGLYLYHNFIPLIERNLVGIESKSKFIPALIPNISSPIYHLVVQTCLLLSVSIISWYLIEKPLLKLKKTNY